VAFQPPGPPEIADAPYRFITADPRTVALPRWKTPAESARGQRILRLSIRAAPREILVHCRVTVSITQIAAPPRPGSRQPVGQALRRSAVEPTSTTRLGRCPSPVFRLRKPPGRLEARNCRQWTVSGCGAARSPRRKQAAFRDAGGPTRDRFRQIVDHVAVDSRRAAPAGPAARPPGRASVPPREQLFKVSGGHRAVECIMRNPDENSSGRRPSPSGIAGRVNWAESANREEELRIAREDPESSYLALDSRLSTLN